MAQQRSRQVPLTIHVFMRLRRPAVSVRELATSAALGVLGVLLVQELGAFEVTGFSRLGPWITLGVTAGLVLGAVRWTMAMLAIDLALLMFYCVIAFTPIMRGLAERWVRNDPLPSRPLDAVVVLSGWVKSDTMLNAAGAERLLTGIELVKHGVAPRLITTRVVARVEGERILSDSGQAWLVHMAGLDRQWSEVDSVSTTRHEATRVGELLGSGRHEVAVVTSPMHTRRACAVFEATGLLVRCVAAREMRAMTWHPAGASDRLAAFSDYVYERLGMVKYRYNGWIKP